MYLHISKWLLRSSNFLQTFLILFDFFLKNFKKWKHFSKHKTEVRTVLLELGIVLGILKKKLLKTSNTVLMLSNSPARHFSPMFHAKCLLPRLDKLLLVRSWLKYFYQCWVFLFVLFGIYTDSFLSFLFSSFAKKGIEK